MYNCGIITDRRKSMLCGCHGKAAVRKGLGAKIFTAWFESISAKQSTVVTLDLFAVSNRGSVGQHSPVLFYYESPESTKKGLTETYGDSSLVEWYGW